MMQTSNLALLCGLHWQSSRTYITVNLIALFAGLAVQESMEMIDNPLHEAAKRGNINFLNECVENRVCNLFG